jgi:FkbM family methyltransferase
LLLCSVVRALDTIRVIGAFLVQMSKIKFRSLSWKDALFPLCAVVLVCFQLFLLKPQLACNRGLSNDTVKACSCADKTEQLTHRDPVFPPKCSTRDFNTIRYQLPVDDCLRLQLKKPVMNACSTSYATRCPDAFWFAEQYDTGRIQSTVEENAALSKAPLAIYVGCNKAMDAVSTLRLISQDSRYSRSVWRDKLYDGKDVYPGVCQQDNAEDRPISLLSEETTHRQALSQNAVVYCIEAMPSTADSLLKTSLQLGWENNLVVTNAAMAKTDGVALFPNVEDTIGAETFGLGDCDIPKYKHLCKEVPVSRLDTFTAKNVPDDAYIEFLSIDAEGYDFDVLSGGVDTLKRSKYLEFEFHWTGSWKNYNLSTAIDLLKDTGFVCYWAGGNGHVWRITDCWLDYFNIHAWSNVACVNLAIPSTASLAARMERLFQETMGADHEIRYRKGNKTIIYKNP